MSEYLDHLIGALEAEAREERAQLERSCVGRLREPRQLVSQLKRTLQRLEILKELRKAETRTSSGPERASCRPARKRRLPEQSDRAV